MKRLLLAGGFLLAVPALAADTGLTLLGVSKSGYTGPGDIVASASIWVSCTRGYSTAYSTGTNKACNARRASDNSTQDINILSNGNLDVASYNTFVGTDATGTCTIATTTLSCTGLGSTLHANDLITGTGITNPCILSSPGSLVGGAQTATAQIAGTTNSCGTVSVGETVVAQVAAFATKAYDQSGNSHDASQATAGNQPQVLPVCINNQPCLYLIAASAQGLTSSTNVSASQPFTQSFVVQFIGSGVQSPLFVTGNVVCVDHSGANTVQLFAGSFGGAVTVNDSTWNSFQAIFNGASSVEFVNGTSHSQSPGAGNLAAGTVTVGGSSSCGGAINGTMGEIGLWGSGFSAGNQSSMHANQSAFYGTP